MLKILYIAPLSLDRKHGRGGIETATENILKGFSDINGIEVLILSFRKETFQTTVTKYSSNIRIIQINLKTKNTLYNILFYQRKIIKKLINTESPDLIHFHGTGPEILSISNLPKDKILITQHGINRIELKYQNTFRNKVKFFLKSIIEYYYFPKFSNYIFISKNNLNYAKKNFKTKFPHYSVIPNTVNSEFLNVKSKIFTNNSILYVGYISRLKNLLMLIKVINELKKKNKIYNLTVVGDIKDRKYYEECRQYITNNDLTEVISFKGYLDQNQLLSLYNKIDIFVLPSLQENCPLSLIEAMAAGKVSVASDIGGIPEIICNSKTGYLFKKNSFGELYDILLLLHNNNLILNYIGKNAHKHIMNRYNPKYIGELTYSFYKTIIND